MKKIAVITSGGDAPGMNAAVRAVVRSALHEGMEVLGSVRGYNGLIHDELIEMSIRSVSDTIHRGGTSLFTARSPEFRTEEGMQKAVDTCKRHGIEGVVVIGGDGSFRGARDLTARGIPCIGVPATIDNDISCTEVTIGYDTATNTVVDMADKLRDTSQSHDRCSVIEVMGRHAGWLTLNAGLAAGATSILVPEVPFDFERDVVQRMKETAAAGKHHFIIMVAEGIGTPMSSPRRSRRLPASRPAPPCSATCSAAVIPPPETACSPLVSVTTPCRCSRRARATASLPSRTRSSSTTISPKRWI